MFSVEDVYLINSAVSSKMVGTMAETEGYNYEETLTGFKWMANRTQELRAQGKTVLLAWEESIGTSQLFLPLSYIAQSYITLIFGGDVYSK